MSSLRKAPGVVIQGALKACAMQAVLDLRRMETRPDHGIHCVRVRMKKLHALLQLLPGGNALRPLKALTRKLRRAFTLNRDRHVLAALVAELSGREPPEGPSAKKASAALLVKARRLAGVACELLAGMASLDLAHLTWEPVLEAHARRYRKGRHQLKQCERDPSPGRLHGLRKTVKDLYYQTLLLRGLKHARRRLGLAHKLASHLGRLHDVDHFLALPPGAQPDRLQRAAKNYRRRLEQRALGTGRRLFKARRIALP